MVGGKREGAGRKKGIPNKASGFIRSLAGEHAETAINTLVEMMESTDTPAAARVSAAREIIERGFGKATNFVTLDLAKSLSEYSPDEAISEINDNVALGKISLEDGQKLVGLIEAKIKAVELAELERRLAELERKK